MPDFTALHRQMEMEINFEGRLQLELLKVCQGAGALGPLLPEVEEITGKWDDYAEQYMADAVGQIDDYPNAAIGWAAFIGMAVAQWWGTDWQVNRFTVCHPISRNSILRFRSLSWLRLIFSCQKAVFVLGKTKYLHSSCPCQKHPLMKITVLYFFRTISGDPGNFFTLSLYLNPRENRNLRTRSSGLVSLLLMLCIHFLRCCGFILSAIQ